MSYRLKGPWTDQAVAAMQAQPAYFAWWYTVKSVGLALTLAALTYQNIPGSGVDTPMTVTWTDGELSTHNYANSVQFLQGDYLSVQVTSTGSISGADMVVELDLF